MARRANAMWKKMLAEYVASPMNPAVDEALLAYIGEAQGLVPGLERLKGPGVGHLARNQFNGTGTTTSAIAAPLPGTLPGFSSLRPPAEPMENCDTVPSRFET
jgi:hypothetical protein